MVKIHTQSRVPGLTIKQPLTQPLTVKGTISPIRRTIQNDTRSQDGYRIRCPQLSTTLTPRTSLEISDQPGTLPRSPPFYPILSRRSSLPTGLATKINFSRYDLDVNPSMGNDDIVQIGFGLRDMVSVLPDVPGVASY